MCGRTVGVLVHNIHHMSYVIHNICRQYTIYAMYAGRRIAYDYDYGVSTLILVRFYYQVKSIYSL